MFFFMHGVSPEGTQETANIGYLGRDKVDWETQAEWAFAFHFCMMGTFIQAIQINNFKNEIHIRQKKEKEKLPLGTPFIILNRAYPHKISLDIIPQLPQFENHWNKE